MDGDYSACIESSKIRIDPSRCFCPGQLVYLMDAHSISVFGFPVFRILFLRQRE